ncbi:DUF3566 domain-containing protein [Haloechinothrix sp. LS1_15]|nr:DUF3566 domain-containing protein [Haloechinothrix sp. LS1_15]
MPHVGEERSSGDLFRSGVDEPEHGGHGESRSGSFPYATADAAEPARAFGYGTGESARSTGGAGESATRERTRVSVPGAQSQNRPEPSALRRPGRGPRRASLQVKRFDPWSVLKLAIVLGIAMFLVWMVAVGLLYTVMDGMGVWDRVNGTYASLVAGDPVDAPADPLITAGRVFSVTAIVGMVNIILMSALATVCAFIYNISADLAGGLELTLSERE